MHRGFTKLFGEPPHKLGKKELLDPDRQPKNPEEAEVQKLTHKLDLLDQRVVEQPFDARFDDCLAKLHNYMDAAFTAHAPTLDTMLKNQESDQLLEDFWIIVEQATICYTPSQQESNIGKFTGRPKPLVKQVVVKSTFHRP